MLYLHWELVDFKVDKTQIIFQTVILAPLLFIYIFDRYRSKEVKYIRHSMLAFTLFMVLPSADYYLSIKDKYQT